MRREIDVFIDVDSFVQSRLCKKNRRLVVKLAGKGIFSFLLLGVLRGESRGFSHYNLWGFLKGNPEDLSRVIFESNLHYFGRNSNKPKLGSRSLVCPNPQNTGTPKPTPTFLAHIFKSIKFHPPCQPPPCRMP